MKIISVAKANANFIQRDNDVFEQSEQLADIVSQAIADTTADAVDTLTMLGHTTKRVVFVDVSEYLDATIQTVMKGFRDENYECALVHMESEEDGERSCMNLLVVTWDPDILRIAGGYQSGHEEEPMAVAKTAPGMEEQEKSGGEFFDVPEDLQPSAVAEDVYEEEGASYDSGAVFRF